MNKDRRKKLKDAIVMLSGAYNIIETLLDQEQSSLSSVPDNLSSSERAYQMEENVLLMEDAVDNMRSAQDHLRSVC